MPTERAAVFQGLAGPLGHAGHHGMRGVTHQCNPPIHPAIEMLLEPDECAIDYGFSGCDVNQAGHRRGFPALKKLKEAFDGVEAWCAREPVRLSLADGDPAEVSVSAD